MIVSLTLKQPKRFPCKSLASRLALYVPPTTIFSSNLRDWVTVYPAVDLNLYGTVLLNTVKKPNFTFVLILSNSKSFLQTNDTFTTTFLPALGGSENDRLRES